MRLIAAIAVVVALSGPALAEDAPRACPVMTVDEFAARIGLVSAHAFGAATNGAGLSDADRRALLDDSDFLDLSAACFREQVRAQRRALMAPVDDNGNPTERTKR